MIAVFKFYHNGLHLQISTQRHSGFLWPLEKVQTKKILGTVPQTLTGAKRANYQLRGKNGEVGKKKGILTETL